MSPSAIAQTLAPEATDEELDRKRNSIKQLLFHMKEERQVISLGNGLYTTQFAFLNNPITTITDNPDNPDNHHVDGAVAVTPVIGYHPPPPDPTPREGHPKDRKG